MTAHESTEMEQGQQGDNLLSRASSEGDGDSWSGKRHWSRWKAGLLLEVTADPSSEGGVHRASMHDVSSAGVGLWLRKEWPARTDIYVREAGNESPAPWLRGNVMHSTRGLRGFLVGVELDERLPE
jgi:hypothetical protein